MVFSLIILGLVLVMILFGATTRLFDKMRIPVAAAVIVVLAIAAGVIIPPIAIGSMFLMSIGGFLIPALVAVIMLFMIGFNMDMVRALLSTVVVAAAVMGLRFLLPMDSLWMGILGAFIIGIVAGGFSYLIGRSRRGALVSAILGVILADVAYFLIARYALNMAVTLSLGVGGMSGAILLSAVVAVMLAELIGTIREKAISASDSRTLQYEAGSDADFDRFDNKDRSDKSDYDDYFKY